MMFFKFYQIAKILGFCPVNSNNRFVVFLAPIFHLFWTISTNIFVIINLTDSVTAKPHNVLLGIYFCLHVSFILTTVISSLIKTDRWKILMEILNVKRNDEWREVSLVTGFHFFHFVLVAMDIYIFFPGNWVQWLKRPIFFYQQYMYIFMAFFIIFTAKLTQKKYIGLNKHFLKTVRSIPMFPEIGRVTLKREINKVRSLYLENLKTVEEMNAVFGWPLCFYFLAAIVQALFIFSYHLHSKKLQITSMIVFCLQILQIVVSTRRLKHCQQKQIQLVFSYIVNPKRYTGCQRNVETVIVEICNLKGGKENSTKFSNSLI